jgi:hypothetical protein
MRAQLSFVRLPFVMVVTVLMASLWLVAPGYAKTGSYRVALLHVTYSDTMPLYTAVQIKAAAGEIHDYYSKISYGQLDLEVLPVEVTLNNTRAFYTAACAPPPQETRNPCPPALIEDAAEAAAAGGLRAYDYECPGPAQGPSGVVWGAWSHEIDHQLEYADSGSSMFAWGTG